MVLIIKGFTNYDSKVCKGILYATLDSFPKIELKPFLIYPASSKTEYDFVDNIGNFLVMTDSYASTKKLMLYDPTKGINHAQELVKPFKDILVQERIKRQNNLFILFEW